MKLEAMALFILSNLSTTIPLRNHALLGSCRDPLQSQNRFSVEDFVKTIFFLTPVIHGVTRESQ